MDGRISYWLGMAALALSSAGCVTTPSATPSGAPASNAAAAGAAPGRECITASLGKKEEYPRRDPKPSTEVKIGEVKEIDADSPNGKKNPEMQSRLRDEARQCYQHAIKLDPNFVDAYRHLGMLYAKMGDFDRSIDTFKKAMAKNAKDANLWHDLGLVYNRKKDFTASIPCFTKALELAPENRDFLKTLGFTLAWQGQMEQGFLYLQRAQGAPMAHYNLARIVLQRDPTDKLSQARQHLREAIQENPQLADAQELLTSLDTPVTAQR